MRLTILIALLTGLLLAAPGFSQTDRDLTEVPLYELVERGDLGLDALATLANLAEAAGLTDMDPDEFSGMTLGELAGRTGLPPRRLIQQLGLASYRPISDPATAINEPSRYAWELFIALNSKPAGLPASAGCVQWETFMEQEQIYADPTRPPQYGPAAQCQWAVHQRSAAPQIENARGRVPAHHVLTGHPAPFGIGAIETVAVNRTGVEYISANDLYYQEGVLRKAMSAEGIQFPRLTKVPKGTWQKITAPQKSRFHWREFDVLVERTDGTTYQAQESRGLIAFGIVTKDLPFWFWATFEHVDNPGRCGVTGCFDEFGVTQPFTAPVRDPYHVYPAEPLSAPLRSLFAAANIDPVFQNYRLKGVQIAFTDSYGRPTILGNSQQEAGQVATSSCMTCHARASVSQGVLPTVQTSQDGLAAIQDAYEHGVPNQILNPAKNDANPVIGFVGTPEAGWYFTNPAGPATEPLQIMFQTDFLWQLPLAPQRRKNWTPPTSQQPSVVEPIP